MAEAADCPSCSKLRIDLEALRHEIRDLRARLNLTSRNSSKPPSSDPPGAPPRPTAKPTGRKPGGQPGHPGAERRQFRPSEIDRRVPVAVEGGRCQRCKTPLSEGRRVEPERRQIVEIPPAVATVTEYVVERVACSGCGLTTFAPLPSGVPYGVVGPRLQAVLALLVGRFRLSRRETEEAAVALFGEKARVSLGWISELEGKTSAALEGADHDVADHVRHSRIAHADETSFREGKKKTWLWTASTALVSLFRIDAERSREAFHRMLGRNYKGTLVTDRWNAYHHHDKRRRQLCWAHLKRNLQDLVDRGRPADVVGRAGLRAVAEIFEAYDEYRTKGTLLATLARRLVPTRRRLLAALERGKKNPDRKAAAICKDVLKLFPSLWTFTRTEGVPPTNNLAERRIRPAVLWRKNSFGCHSAAGSRFAERMMTVVQTLRAQGRDVLAFLEATIRAALTGVKPPRILPA